MNNIRNSERGASMLYVLAALIFVGFVSASMLKLSTGDSVNSVFYKTSASARSAAKSGMISAIHFFENGGDPVRVLLQKWVDEESAPVDSAFTWIKGGDNSYIDMDGNKVTDPSGIQAYKVELLAFDTSTFNVTLRSTGVGKGKSRSEITAVHHLDGLAFGTRQDWTHENAIYIEDGVTLNFKGPIDVTGGVRLSSESSFDGWAAGSIFRGKFRTEYDLNAPPMVFKGQFTFLDTAYLGTKPRWENHQNSISGVWFPGQNIFNAEVGFPSGSFSIDALDNPEQFIELQLNKPSYWLVEPETRGDYGDVAGTWISLIEDGNHVVQHESFNLGTDMQMKDKDGQQIERKDGSGNLVKNYNDVVDNSLTPEKILDLLGFPQQPCQIDINPNVIPDSVITQITSLSASDINGWTGNVWNGFIVLKLSTSITVSDAGSPIHKDKKVILFVENGGVLQSGYTGKVFSVEVNNNPADVDSSNSGHFTVIVKNGGKVLNWGGWQGMRGLYYRMNGGEMQIGGANNQGINNMYGALYAEAGDTIKWYPRALDVNNNPAPGTLVYDPTVYDELDFNGQDDGTGRGNTNFLTKEGCPGNVPISTGDLTINGSIQASMVSQHF